jgi:hypothetical protein
MKKQITKARNQPKQQRERRERPQYRDRVPPQQHQQQQMDLITPADPRPSKKQSIPTNLLAPFGKFPVLPSINPLNMPVSAKDMLKMPSPQELRGLQVKAELNKLGPAPLSYARLLELDQTNTMEVDDGQEAGRLLFRDRFDRIQKARPAVPMVLLNAQKRMEKGGLFNEPNQREESKSGLKEHSERKYPVNKKRKQMLLARQKKRARLTHRNLKAFEKENAGDGDE